MIAVTRDPLHEAVRDAMKKHHDGRTARLIGTGLVFAWVGLLGVKWFATLMGRHFMEAHNEFDASLGAFGHLAFSIIMVFLGLALIVVAWRSDARQPVYSILAASAWVFLSLTLILSNLPLLGGLCLAGATEGVLAWWWGE